MGKDTVISNAKNAMKLSKTLITLACVCAAGISEAATGNFYFNTDADNIELWDAMAQDSAYGSFVGNQPYEIWCDQILVYNNDSKNVNLILTKPYTDGYPLYTSGGVNLGIYNLNLMVDGFDAYMSLNSLFVRNSATLTVQNGAQVTLNGNFEGNKTDFQNSTVLIKGESTFIQNGNSTYIGGENNTSAFTFRMEGENLVKFRNLRFTGAEGTSAANPIGGKLEFIADESGITTIQHESTVLDFSGVVLVDFSNLIWDESWGGECKFTLVSATNNSATAFEYFCDNQATLAEVKGVGDWLFSYDNNNLYINVSQVPEPATCAAIFGALALALAAYRRRR